MALDQYFTPAWAAELIVQKFYPTLNEEDCVLEPSCGDGRFLLAIPEHVRALGVEIDPVMAETARNNTGRHVITGSFQAADIPYKPTLIIGNPPFQTKLIDQFLDRAYQLLDLDQEVGFLLPCYVFQTVGRVTRYNRHWGLDQTMLPKGLFDQITTPLMFARFIKERQPRMSNLFLYLELQAVKELASTYRPMFVGNASRAHVWGEAVERALIALGGQATLQQIYAELEGKRPTENPWWRPQIRKVCRQFFQPVERGQYRLCPA